MLKQWLRRLHAAFLRSRPSPKKAARRHARAILGVEPLEDRIALTGNINLTNAFLVNANNPALTAPLDIGEEVFINATWTTQGLPSNASYRVSCTVDGVTLYSNYGTWGAGGAESRPWSLSLGGWFASPGTHSATVTVDPDHSVPGTTYTNDPYPFTFTPVAAPDLPQKFITPLGGTPFQTWGITNYVDVDPRSGSFTDYQGGPYTADGANGHDLVLATFASMDAGVPVFAAAAGTVSAVSDGNNDNRNPTTSGGVNSVVIDSGNGWQTIYDDFRTDTILVHVGDQVVGGQVLGLAGSSGSATLAELHFEIKHNGDLVEPEYDPTTYWANPLPYQGSFSDILDSGVTSSQTTAQADLNAMERPATANVFTEAAGQQITVWLAADTRSNDSVTLTFYQPDGTPYTPLNHSLPPPGLLRGGYLNASTTLPSDLTPGTWNVGISINGTQMALDSFQVTAGGAGAAHVTQGGTYVSNGRTTPIDFGTVSQGATPPQLAFTVANLGSAALAVSNLVLPSGFTLVGPFPTSIPVGSSAAFTIQMATTASGTDAGMLAFNTSDPNAPTYNFNIKGTVSGGNTGEIHGQVFNDVNADGIENGSDSGLVGWTVSLLNPANNSVIATTTTGYNGYYAFLNLAPGTYRVRETAPFPWAQSTTDPADVAVGTSDVLVSPFGVFPARFPISVPSTVTAGSSFSITVTALDASNNTFTGYSGTVHFTSSDSQAVLPGAATLTNGVGAFSVTLETAGNRTLTATDTQTGMKGISSTITVNPAAATHFAISAPGNAAPGTNFGFTVTAQDQFNNTATGYSGTIDFSSSDAAAILPASGTLTAGAGVFSAMLQTAGNQVVTATDAVVGSISGTSNAIGFLVASMWTPLVNPASPTSGTGTMLLLPDGTVMVQGAGVSNNWLQLTPDSSGSYVNGTWGQLASMSLQRLYYASDVLTDGRVFVLGGEYSGSPSANNDTNTAEIYGPAANTWQSAAPFPQGSFGDGITAMLPNGDILAGYISGPQTYIYDPSTNTWSAGGTKLRGDASSEESWVQMQDGSILSYDISSGSGRAQRYVPATNTWVDAGAVPVSLSSFGELGPAFLLPDGRAIFFGDNGNTAYYTPLTNTWAAGPVIPNALACADVPGAMMPNGDILIATGPNPTNGGVSGPTTIFELDPTTNTFTNVTPASGLSALNGAAIYDRMVVLPSGQVLFTSSNSQLLIYTPAGSPLSSWRAAISSITSNGDGSFTLTGTQLNGMSEGAAYGDDAQMATGYPVVRLVNGGGQVVYARTFSWSNTGLASGTTPESAVFTPPAGFNLNSSTQVSVAASGIASISEMFGDIGVTHFSVVSNSGSTTAGNPLVIVVAAENQFNNTATGFAGTVTFTSTDNGASTVLPIPSVLSAGAGTFSLTLTTVGSQTLTATDGTILGTSAAITVSPAAATHFVFSTTPTSISAGTAFRFTLTARDQFNNTATSYSGTVALSSSDSAASFVPESRPLTSGVGAFSVTLRTAGNQSLIAADSLTAGIAGTSNTIGVRPLAATHLVLSGTPTGSTGSTAGVAFSFTVNAEDMFDNIATGYTGTVTMLSTDNAAVFVPAKSALTSGVGTFTATLETAGGQTLTATDFGGSSLTGTSLPFLVHAGPATHLVTSATPHSLTAGTPFSITVTALDSFNNTAIGYAGTVALASSDPAAELTPASNTLASGVGTFSVTLETAGMQTLTVKDAVATTITGTSSTIAVLTGAPAHFLINGVPTTISAGTALRFTVTAQDAFNNTATSYTGTVTISASDSAASLPQASRLTSGVGVFSATLVTAGNQTLTAADTANNTISGTSTITVIPLAATHFLVSDPGSVQAGQLFSFMVTAEDQFNNAATSYGGTVNFSSSDGRAVLSDPSTLTGGVGSFGAILVTAGNQTITANDSVASTLSGATAGFTVTPSSLNDLRVGAPINATAGAGFTVTVTAEDQFGNTITTYGGTVQFSSSDGRAVLAGNTALTSGVGSFSATLATAGNQTLTAADAAASGIAGSAAIQVIPAPATHFAVGAPTSVTAGHSFILTVTAEDRFNNTAAGFAGTVRFTSSDSQAGLPVQATLINGTGQFGTILDTAGNQTITASGEVATAATISGSSGSIAVSPAAATHLTVKPAALPSYPGMAAAYPNLPGTATSVASTGSPVAFTVTALDPFGNIVPNYHGTVSFTSSDAATNVSLPANSTLTGGVGIFSATFETAGNQLITATDMASPSISGASSPIPVRGLVVTSFTTTPTGFTVTFNKPFQPDTVNLYTVSALPDVVILTTSGTQVSVRGSVLFNSATSPTSMTFIKTAAVSSLGIFNPGTGLLAAGSYTATLRSFSAASSGFQDALGSLLDGNNSGSPGANFVFTFSVSTPPVAVGIPDFARGPSNTDALFLPSTIGNGNTFNLIYTNPNTAPTTGMATITFSTTAATLLNNIQNALNALPQVGLSGSIPNSAVVITNDSSTAGANVLVTFQNALAQAANQLLASSTPGVTISLANINAAQNIPGNGIPIALSSGQGVTSGSFTLQYNPALLNITGAVSKIIGATFTLNTTINNATSATAVLSLSSPSAFSSTATAITIGCLLATVPLSATASYGAAQLLHFSSEQLNRTAGPIPVTNQDGVQVVAYLGDVADKGGPFTLQDATAISAVAGGIANTVAQTIPGFATFPNLDPAIVGDVSLAGTVNFADATLMNQQLVSAQVKIPYAPIGLPVTVSAAVVRLAATPLQGVPASAGGSGWQLNAQVNAQQAPVGMAKPDWLADDELVYWAQTAQHGLLTSAVDLLDSAAPGPDGCDPAGLEAYFAREGRLGYSKSKTW